MSHKTDSRPHAERKLSVTMRISELRKALAAAERSDAELDTEIEEAERARERVANDCAGTAARAHG